MSDKHDYKVNDYFLNNESGTIKNIKDYLGDTSNSNNKAYEEKLDIMVKVGTIKASWKGKIKTYTRNKPYWEHYLDSESVKSVSKKLVSENKPIDEHIMNIVPEGVAIFKTDKVARKLVLKAILSVMLENNKKENVMKEIDNVIAEIKGYNTQ